MVDRFQVLPSTPGQVRWANPSTLVFDHPPLAIDTEYTVILAAGFRDQEGIGSQFRHSWRFRTEKAPALTQSSPANRERGVDPAAYLTIAFNRDMNAASFQGAVSFSPEIPYQVRLEASDPHRVVIAPRALLDPDTHYALTVTSQALDADGNRVPPTELSFATGAVRPLQHWITFIASTTPGGSGSGIWMVDENRFPRLLTDQAVDQFTWAHDAGRLLLRDSGGGWALLVPGSRPVQLPFEARWAAYLGPERGFLYLLGDNLERLGPDQAVQHLASGVGEVAVAPGLDRIAFTVTGPAAGEIDGYDLSLRARYIILRDAQPVSNLAWSLNGLRLAYILVGAAGGQSQLRVKSLTGTGPVTTVATGEIAEPAWLADSNYLTFSAAIQSGGQPRWRIFRINASLPPPRLTPQLALGGSLAGDMTSPKPSPDGHQIAFLAGDGDSTQVWLMNADGTGLQNLTAFDAAAFPYSCRALHWAGF